MSKIIIFLIIHVTVSIANKTNKRYILKNIEDLEVEENRSIFFLDTTIVSHDFTNVQMKHRTACSVESAATMHENRIIYVLYATPGFVDLNDQESKYLQVLLGLRNVRIAHVDITRLARKTPAEQLLKTNRIELSQFKINHYSDLVRLLLLWRYGGIYLDNDVLVLKSFEGLSRNFVGMEDNEMIANCVLGFHGKIFRERYIGDILLNEFRNQYDHGTWGGNGPILLTKFVRRLYGTEQLPNTMNRICHGLRVYPKSHFCPVHYTSWAEYFQETRTQTLVKETKDSYALHFWNFKSKGKRAKTSWDAPYVHYAKEYCPKIMKIVPEYF